MNDKPTKNNDPRDTEEKDLADELEIPDSGIPIPDIEDPFMAEIYHDLCTRKLIASNRTPVEKVWVWVTYENKTVDGVLPWMVWPMMLLDIKNGDGWRTKYIDMRKIEEIEYDYVVRDEIGYPANRKPRYSRMYPRTPKNSRIKPDVPKLTQVNPS